MGRTVAAFDFDGTVYPGDSLLPFLRRLLPGPVLGRAAAGAWRELARLPLGGAHRDVAKAALLARCLAGLPVERLTVEAERYSQVLQDRLRPDVLARARWHGDQGHEVILVSASPEPYLLPLARRLGFGAVLATRLEVGADGRLTGRLHGANVRGEEKVRRLVEWLAGDDDVLLWAYGDSEGDRELLARADRATRVTRRPLPATPTDLEEIPPHP